MHALQVPAEKVFEDFLEHVDMPLEELAMVQRLWFLQKWLVPLATASRAALLWAGFWDGDSNRTSGSGCV